MAKIIIFGGSGFIGQYVVKKLAADNHIIKIFARDSTKASELKVCGNVGQIVCVTGNVLNDKLLEKHLEGMDVAINLVGILYEKRPNEFNLIHNIAAQKIAKYAQAANVKQFIHLSALGIEQPSKYNDSKLAGENAIKKEFLEVNIIRPSVVFGEEDDFFNKFAKLAQFLPFLPMIDGGKSLFQPVFVGDVAQCIYTIISQRMYNNTFHLVGTKQYSFKELMQFIMKTINRKRFLLSMPSCIAKFMAFFLEWKILCLLLKPITGNMAPILTRDQVQLLKYNNTIDSIDLENIGITPRTIEDIVPKYLQRYQKDA